MVHVKWYLEVEQKVFHIISNMLLILAGICKTDL